jgi:hypothetical protein
MRIFITNDYHTDSLHRYPPSEGLPPGKWGDRLTISLAKLAFAGKVPPSKACEPRQVWAEGTMPASFD